MKRTELAFHLGIGLVSGLMAMTPALAAKRYTTIDYPGAAVTACVGLNNRNQVACVAFSNDGSTIPFRYDLPSMSVVILPTSPASGTFDDTFGLNDFDTAVGIAHTPDYSVEKAFTLSAEGVYQEFSIPGAAYTEGHGVNDRGLITGTVYLPDGTSAGFAYNPWNHGHTEFLPSPYTEAQGVNSIGQIVGTVYLDAGAAGPGLPAGQYGYLREPNASVRYFRVNGQDTYARGLSEFGTIVGYSGDLSTRMVTGFALTEAELYGRKAQAPGFTAVRIATGDLIAVPGQVGTLAQGANIEGDISGTYIDSSGNAHGFVARNSLK